MTDQNSLIAKPILRPIHLVGTILAIAFLAISGYWTFSFSKQVAAESPIITQPDIDEFVPTPIAQTELRSPVLAINNGTLDSAELETVEESAVPQVQQAWTGTGRVTILLMGIDRRCGEVGPVRTDSLMLLTVDPIGKTAAILSLPRDLWVEIPGFGIERINQAHYFGEIFEYPGGGPTLAVDTVEALLGTDIHYFATVSFEAFTEVVDLLGGITLDVPEAINDPFYPDECYGFDPFTIEPGQHTFNGHDALRYARTRATASGDLGRADRQQQVVLAVRDAAASQIGELILKAPRVWEALSQNVLTTMQLEEALQLAWLLPEIPRENIRNGVIGDDYVFTVQNSDEQFVLVPRRQAIRDLRDSLFALPGAAHIDNKDQLARLFDQVGEEDAAIAIYNGTQAFGLATDTQLWLEAEGVAIAVVGNDDSSTNSTTRIIQYGDFPATVDLLIELLDVPPLNVENGDIPPEPGVEVLVILGVDWEIPAE
ncbi:MAG: LCP family protein required for cell wall assembly [Cellvibrionaceae bacterium]|jgi:LCP family protein required for cell wall assembly